MTEVARESLWSAHCIEAAREGLTLFYHSVL